MYLPFCEELGIHPQMILFQKQIDISTIPAEEIPGQELASFSYLAVSID